MQFSDDAEFQINIDLDNGARISSLIWRDMQITLPYRGQPHTHGWYAMGPWAGRIKDGLIKNSKGEVFELPTNIDPPNALHGFGYTSSWQDIGPGRALLHLPAPYGGATLEQRIEVLDDGPLMVVLEKAAQAAAITCSRHGAQPPTKKELNGFNAIY